VCKGTKHVYLLTNIYKILPLLLLKLILLVYLHLSTKFSFQNYDFHKNVRSMLLYMLYPCTIYVYVDNV